MTTTTMMVPPMPPLIPLRRLRSVLRPLPSCTRIRARARAGRGISVHPVPVVVAGEDLEAADVGVFAVLVVFDDEHLDYHGF